MSNFPLYDSMISNLPKKAISAKQKKEFVDNIENLDKNARGLIYALIQVYFRENNKNSKLTAKLPYGGIREQNDTDNENLSWNFSDFPTKLKKILHKFVTMHMKNISSETTGGESIGELVGELAEMEI